MAALLVPSLADPSEALIRPEKVVSATGDVLNASALAGGRGVATLGWNGYGPAPQARSY